jgi:hypothetical protein
MSQEKIRKSLSALIDETLAELEELKKSRLEAEEIDLHSGKDGTMHGHPANGSLKAESVEEDKDEDEMDHDEDGVNRKAAPKRGEHVEAESVAKDEDKEEEDEDDEEDYEEDVKKEEEAQKGLGWRPSQAGPSKAGRLRGKMGGASSPADAASTSMTSAVSKEEGDEEGVNRKAAPKRGKHVEAQSVSKEESKEDGSPWLKKSLQEQESLMKTFVEERVKPIESKLETLMALVKKIADQPEPPKAATYRSIVPLAKTDGSSEPLTKAMVVNKLLELKKSGVEVDSLDVVKADLNQDLEGLARKYKLN